MKIEYLTGDNCNEIESEQNQTDKFWLLVMSLCGHVDCNDIYSREFDDN
jgi:hypothetical protein